jgi:UDP-glucose:(heptosyl)LPS alpha-1,3-glucosyltransferase
MPMKLGFVLFDYFPFGGLQRDCLAIARQCVGRGHSVTLLARTWQGEPPAGLEIKLFGRHGLSNVRRNQWFLRQLAEAVPKESFDGLVGFNKMPGLDVYYGADPCYVAKVRRLKPAWYRWLPRYRHFAALERAVYGRGQSTTLLLLKPTEIPLYQEFYGTEPERFQVLPPGIARQSFTDSERCEIRHQVRQQQQWAEHDPLLLFVGSGFRIKGLDRAITGLAGLVQGGYPKARLVVIGQGSPGRFVAQARRAGVGERVHFLGGRHDVPRFMLAADLLVHPAYSENTGTILLEALALGLPVLTTDICGYAFHVDRAGAGIVLPSPFQPATFEEALRKMLAPGPRTTWSTQGLAYAAREDLYSCYEQAARIIEQTIAAAGRGNKPAGIGNDARR